MGDKSTKGDFKLGNPGGPGRPLIPEEFKAVQKMHKDIFERVIAKYLLMTIDELKALREDAQRLGALPVIEGYLISIVIEGMRTGNHQIMEWLACRSVGRVQDDTGEDEQKGHKQLVEFFKNRKQSLEEKK